MAATPISVVPLSEVWVTTPGAGAAGQGTTSTKIRRYTVANTNTGTAITYADSSTLGGTFTINEDGMYFMCRNDGLASGVIVNIGISRNSNQLTTAVESLTAAHQIVTGTATFGGYVGIQTRLTAGDVIRAHDSGTVCTLTTLSQMFRIIKVAN